MAKPFRTSRIVEFSDTDMAGIMHFASFFRYMESAEHEMLREWGFSIFDEFDGQNISFPRVAVSCEYHSPARSEDVLDIEISVRTIGKKSITYGLHFSCDDREVATGEVTAVCCRIEYGKPLKSVEIPAPLVAHLQELLET